MTYEITKTRTSIDTYSKLHYKFIKEEIPLTNHMYTLWARYDMRTQFHINSNQNRLKYIVWYLLDAPESSSFKNYELPSNLLSILNAPVEAFGPMTRFLHMVWMQKYRHDPQMNIYEENGYARFASIVLFDYPQVSILKKLVPVGMVAAMNVPDYYDGRRYSSKATKALHDRVDAYRSKYNWQDWREREAFNFELIHFLYVEQGNDIAIGSEAIKYWSGKVEGFSPSITRYALASALLSDDFSFSDVDAASAHAKDIEQWFDNDFVKHYPRAKIFATSPNSANLSLSGREAARKRLKSKFGIEYLPGDSSEEIDVLLVGPFSAASGLGTGTRRSVEALERLGVKLKIVNLMFDNPAAAMENIPEKLRYEGERPKITLWHFNAEYLPEVLHTVPEFINPQKNIGYFFWETEVMPENHQLACDLVDEIWVPSDFVGLCYENKGVPVTNVNTSVNLPSVNKAIGRDHFGLSDDEFVVMFSFDSHSVIHRKNPAAVVRAFQRAFPIGNERVRLILKTQNLATAHWGNINGRGEELLELVSADPRIELLDRTMTLDELYALKSHADCYMSLHRSEGFGYGPAEAMALARPTIMTNYSANVEFGAEGTCHLVDGELIHILHAEYLYWRPEMMWCEVDVDKAAAALRHVYDNPEEARAMGERAAIHIKTHFGVEAMAEKYRVRLKELGILH